MSSPYELARITITRTFEDGEDLVRVSTADECGEPLALVLSLGMLRLAEGLVIADASEDSEDAG